MKSKKTLQIALDNANNDRFRLMSLIDEILEEGKSDPSFRRKNAMSLAKLYEVLQKSNEQIIKCASISGKGEVAKEQQTLDLKEIEDVYENFDGSKN